MKQIAEYHIVDHGLQKPDFTLPKESQFGPEWTYVLGLGDTPVLACYFALRGLQHAGWNTSIVEVPDLKGYSAKKQFAQWKDKDDNPVWHVSVHVRE